MVPVPHPYPTPPIVQCDQTNFFGTRSQLSAVEARLGTLVACGRFESQTQWILIFGGQRPNPAWTASSASSVPPTIVAPFGDWSIATDTCATTDTNCLHPSAGHTFASFTVYQPPSWPGVGFSHLPTITSIYGSKLIALPNGPCYQVVFNVDNHVWYEPTGKGQFNALLAGDASGMPRFANQPQSLSADEALTKSRPSSTSQPSACPIAR